MGKVLEAIGPSEEEFIAKQKVFFVGTAPLSKDHHINVSPKAPGSSVLVLGSHKVAYADLTGSGSETAAHILENQRMVLMFCNLEEGAPKIIRLHGKATMVIKEKLPSDLLQRFPVSLTSNAGFRCVFVLDVERISSSCGYSLPVMHYEKTRKILDEYSERKGVEGMKDYCLTKNSFSIDGLYSIAHLRNPDKTIAANPHDGYIFGEEVSTNDPRAKQNVVPKPHRSSSAFELPAVLLLLTAAFLLGGAAGHFLTESISDLVATVVGTNTEL